MPSAAGADLDLDGPTFLSLVGHPLRWALLCELARSDRTVHELTERIDQPQNLVSYHLGRLRDAGLVASRRSSADGRDAYYRAELARLGEELAATGGELHPGLRLVPPSNIGAAPVASRRRKPRVLFLCTGNSARSQMAEALTLARSGGAVVVRSAGSHPKPLHPNAVRAMREVFGVDISGAKTKHLSRFEQQRFDRVISLCDRVREICPDFPGEPETVHWSIPDPAAGQQHDGDLDASYPAFVDLAAHLDTRVTFLLADIGAPTIVN